MALPLSTTRRRPNTSKILAIFTVLAILGAWLLRIAPMLYDMPVGYVYHVKKGVLPNGVHIKKYFGGMKALDEGLSFLITAFIYGPTKWNESFY